MEKRTGPNDGSESEPKKPQQQADIASLQKIIISQNEALLAISNKLESLEKHQDQTDTAIIEVAKKVGSSGGKSSLLAELAPLLASSRGPSPMEKIAMNMFMRNIAFSTLTTERLAKKQFGEEYTKMVKDMEAEMSGAGDEAK